MFPFSFPPSLSHHFHLPPPTPLFFPLSFFSFSFSLSPFLSLLIGGNPLPLLLLHLLPSSFLVFIKQLHHATSRLHRPVFLAPTRLAIATSAALRRQSDPSNSSLNPIAITSIPSPTPSQPNRPEPSRLELVRPPEQPPPFIFTIASTAACPSTISLSLPTVPSHARGAPADVPSSFFFLLLLLRSSSIAPSYLALAKPKLHPTRRLTSTWTRAHRFSSQPRSKPDAPRFVSPTLNTQSSSLILPPQHYLAIHLCRHCCPVAHRHPLSSFLCPTSIFFFVFLPSPLHLRPPSLFSLELHLTLRSSSPPPFALAQARRP